MRTEIALLAGPRLWGDTRKSWLGRVPKAVKRELKTEKETVSYRMVRSLFYGVITDPEHHAARDIRLAAQLFKARGEALKLAEKYEALLGDMNASVNADRYSADIARLERVVGILFSVDRA